MAFHSVLIPPVTATRPARAALEQAVFIKDGFSMPAFLFTGLWLLTKRLWLPFVLFMALWGMVAVGGRWTGFNPLALALAQLVIAVYLGFEAPALLERGLLARGWRHAGVVEGRDLDLVQRRFFEAAMAPASVQPGPVRADASAATVNTSSADTGPGVLGLFPNPAAR